VAFFENIHLAGLTVPLLIIRIRNYDLMMMMMMYHHHLLNNRIEAHEYN